MTIADVHEALSVLLIRSRPYRLLCRLHGHVVVRQFTGPERYGLAHRAAVAGLRCLLDACESGLRVGESNGR